MLITNIVHNELFQSPETTHVLQTSSDDFTSSYTVKTTGL